ncbi:MAG: DUF86 domain-containing protein [Flavobacteriales bacterium]
MRRAAGQRYDFFLLEMREAIAHILTYAEELDTELEFSQNRMRRDAIIRNFEILGECVKHIPFRFQKRYPSVPWSQMLFLRNFIVHEFFDIDDTIIWSIIRTDLKRNLADFDHMLASPHM